MYYIYNIQILNIRVNVKIMILSYPLHPFYHIHVYIHILYIFLMRLAVISNTLPKKKKKMKYKNSRHSLQNMVPQHQKRSAPQSLVFSRISCYSQFNIYFDSTAQCRIQTSSDSSFLVNRSKQTYCMYICMSLYT